MSDQREWISVRIAARRARYSLNYFRENWCFTGDGPRPFIIRSRPTPGGRRHIEVDGISLGSWLRRQELGIPSYL